MSDTHESETAVPPRVEVRPTLAASAAVFRGPLVLLARRAANPGAGLWSLPGGRVEPGETVAEAAMRELMEEVGVEAEIVGLAAARDIIVRNREGELKAHFVVLAHAARWRGGEPMPGEEAAEVGWFRPNEVAGLTTTEGLAEVVAKAALLMGEM
ncbi:MULTISPECIES: NUDIX hydrolase [Xanthobacter]|uniref:ADP-ribose pyrophosphatase YjhB (NUDIX family) n=1 Tax=Xanthobacter flavus TaxID=281 RepID=A0A9W6CIX9_XANFL|nr:MULTISPECIES: NUDIX hydrolase [Xanthobacter]MBN8916692.1 NUDIX hydrolase [Hyphomicrobiales bacterium]MDR6334703.1 ADP-ribose pyrophosphatase YjhB (NUDIX family) [Xanthobacter flavus]UDQ90485.1 NUDIX hydrolase [Xanthobacter autotrophicus]UJX44826.1 NUDIX domain-containing protein [Xanthobacter sp. YC-JY1]GLI23276.1 NUDIX hydrolase [Xanthobacter flavus]